MPSPAATPTPTVPAVEVAPEPAPLPSLPAPAEADSLDDADALPAVGKVWDTGPKRSFSEIMAAASRQKAAPAADSPARPSAIPTDLAQIWQRFLQEVNTQIGQVAQGPLLSSRPRRDGERLIIPVSGFMARVLEKHRDPMQSILASVSGGQMTGITLEVDDAPAQAVPVIPAAANSPARPVNPQLTAVAGTVKEAIPLTPELRQELEQNPLIRAAMEQLNANIVKVE